MTERNSSFMNPETGKVTQIYVPSVLGFFLQGHRIRFTLYDIQLNNTQGKN